MSTNPESRNEGPERCRVVEARDSVRAAVSSSRDVETPVRSAPLIRWQPKLVKRPPPAERGGESAGAGGELRERTPAVSGSAGLCGRAGGGAHRWSHTPCSPAWMTAAGYSSPARPGIISTADQLLVQPRDTIRCLEDTDGDGRFDKSTIFADHLTYPQGVLWHDGAVYTASPPSLWRLEDTDGDGVADRRTELVTGFPFTGIADDLHGPCLGPDGRIYWQVGRFPYSIRKPGGPTIREGDTPLIMRCRPDGEEVEVFSAAMGNPVEVAFTPEGEPIACGTFLSPESQGAGFRDALIHCVYGGLYSVRDRELSTQKRTGDPLPPLVQLGVAAGSGLTLARGGALRRRDAPDGLSGPVQPAERPALRSGT